MLRQSTILISTTGNGDVQDLTPRVEYIIKKSKVKAGIVHVFVVGSTAGIGAIEFEPGLQKDLPAVLNKLIPPSRSYGHEQAWHDGNGHSHLQATLLGPDITVPFKDGKLALGTWQQVIHAEFDVRPRDRTIIVTVMGD